MGYNIPSRGKHNGRAIFIYQVVILMPELSALGEVTEYRAILEARENDNRENQSFYC